MNFKEIARRISGFSTPAFGISWEPSPSDRDAAKRVVAFLEDQRLLLGRYETVGENIRYVKVALYRMRGYLTEEIGRLESGSQLAKSLRAMRAASRRCLERVEETPEEDFFRGSGHDSPITGTFLAIGEFRSSIGFHLAAICSSYSLSLEEELASLLPAELEEDDAHGTGPKF